MRSQGWIEFQTAQPTCFVPTGFPSWDPRPINLGPMLEQQLEDGSVPTVKCCQESAPVFFVLQIRIGPIVERRPSRPPPSRCQLCVHTHVSTTRVIVTANHPTITDIFIPQRTAHDVASRIDLLARNSRATSGSSFHVAAFTLPASPVTAAYPFGHGTVRLRYGRSQRRAEEDARGSQLRGQKICKFTGLQFLSPERSADTQLPSAGKPIWIHVSRGITAALPLKYGLE
ncbi:hypothetical protein B0H14DRAFT_2584311 [Mycena olivaceomarginata]|nr:hypothetical protein B0H14DRAFT_2584311 [Mycena olivaceomarginata]